jgi:hypothetical protein
MSRKRTVTKRPSYGDAVRWIASNDAPGDAVSTEELGGYLSVLLVADLFGADSLQVAIDVERTRAGAGPFA